MQLEFGKRGRLAAARRPAMPVRMSLALVVVIFFTIVVSLLFLNNARSGILSGVRAYVNGEGLYSKGQKDAVNFLTLYAASRRQSDYEKFERALDVPLGDGRARRELEKPNPDHARVAEGFLAGRNHPDDIEGMTQLFLRFRHISFMAKAIDIWTQGDSLIVKLQQLGQQLHAAIHDAPVNEEAIAHLLREVQALNEELTVLEDDFSRTLGEGNRWLERRLLQLMYGVTALLFVAGAIASWMVFGQVRDANQALQTQAERWRVTLASIGDAVLVTDAHAIVVSLNQVAEELSGWSEEEAIGRSLQEVLRLSDDQAREPTEHPVYRALHDGRIVGLGEHTTLSAKDGTRRSIDDSAAPIKDEEGNIVGAVLVFRDVSERRRAEEVMRRSEERYRSLVTVTTSVVWTTDAQGHFVAPQPSWEAYTGRDWKANTKDGWLSALHSEDREVLSPLWMHALGERSVLRAEARNWHAASGKYRHCVAHAVPLLNADATVREWIGTLTDVDDRKRAEEALQQANRQKDDFLAMLAHELRNPLSPIRNAVHILKRAAEVEPRVARAGEMIDRQVGHMTRLLDDLLDVSRIARGKISLRREILDLAQVVRLTSEDYRPTLEAGGLQFSVNLPEEPVWILGDATRLAQAVGNLLHNASKFSPPGTHVTVELSHDTQRNQSVLSVADTGIGMEASMLESVFETFSQADHSLDRSRGGLGLGLALVKGLIEMHGGSAQAFSAGLGKGSEFVLRLPLQLPPADIRTIDHHSTPAPHARRILVIEDNPDVAESMRYLLEADGHEVMIAQNGAAGIDAAQSFRPDVVLCDIGLPGGMDGFDVARAMRRTPSLSGLYLVALTGYGQEEYQRQAREAGFDVHLTKPVNPTALDDLLANLPATQDKSVTSGVG